MKRAALEYHWRWPHGGLAWSLAALLVPPTFAELVLAVSPPLAVYSAYGAASALLLWRLYGPRPTPALMAALAVLGVLLVCLFSVPWNSRKAFLHDFRRVAPGMAVGELDALMQKYEFGERRVDDGAVERTYVHSRDGRFDSDWGVVRLQHGRVASAQFLPD